ncbi:3'-5' exoribonuclease YhaM family protein [Paramaledivibacter caminithermalis]|jgi:3'-5' exoribonuclease|uniref:3'-5' exoribonuclease n=1 Tax=Paramaledivibacter caminithermalis (strain DSM 15212 / CIP 107654 / DViRD3) TaxID=1121301 RepID=A0A1M6MT58_PARC5|nr:HD domain-containing protein [Paramaledivibacter caminithermalis]SHJ86698.1 3'-5' exoribonuclease [Paramaledivibacter caminithermalis DSM 15212]
MNTNIRISDFKLGDFIEGFFIIKSMNIKTSSNNKNFIDFNLVDKTGEINAKLWDSNKDDEKKYSEGKLVKVRGNVSEWQGKLQLKIIKIRPANDEDNLVIDDYVPSAPEKTEIMYEKILDYIREINNKDIHNIVSYIFKESKEKLMFYPAAKSNHHAILGGLLYHILTMLRTAEKLCEIYTFLDKNLLFGGVILHDIAKLEEMDSNELGIVSSYTSEGELLGHIIQGINKIEKVSEKLNTDKEITTLLQHMILSHHYEPEFGSPKRPMIPEAEILHYLDVIDARMFDMKRTLESTKPKGFSDKIWTLHNRRLYKPSYQNLNEE